MAAGNDLTFLQNLINSFRQDAIIDGDELQDLFQTIRNVLSANNTSVLNLAYDNAITYDTPATAGTSGNPSYAEFDDRFWRSKTDDNVGNEPPSSEAVTENTNWIEVSKAEANAFQEWTPGIYGSGLIIVFHNDGTFSQYAHFKKDGIVVKEGDTLKKGQLIGYSGNTGQSTEPHLHFVVYKPTHNGLESIPFKLDSIPSSRYQTGKYASNN
jgi:hypothetical protein